ncbi:MAG: hypothetical protein DBX47_00750 [Clostridiales bacterium]|nr:MAG: hypothetical protein DBX47_00750 [Clostridiales bacterium]
MEIGEIKLFDNIPGELTYPEIQPLLFEYIQGWLNLQNSPNELWDVYDENRNLISRIHRRGDFLAKGDYHIVVHVWIQNTNGEFLLTKRTPNKGFPNMWECTGGSALAGEDSLTAAMREVEEETGLLLDPDAGRCIMTLKREDNFGDVWLFRQDFDLNDVVFQPNETCDAMWATETQIKKMKEDGILVPFSYLDEFFMRIEYDD